MNIAILATGDEIVHGDTLNTNAQNLAQMLHAEGLPPQLHLACCDSEQQIIDSLHWLSINHRFIIITGGLGPTSDDKTRFALAKFLQTPLIEFQEALTHLRNRFQHTDVALNEGNLQQILFPENSNLLPNPNGSAMGAYCKVNEITYVLLPGPPRECLPMFQDHVLPILQTVYHSNKQLLKWRLFGVAESVIAEKLDKAVADLVCDTGYRLEVPYVEFKVRCHADLVDQVTQRIAPLVAPYLIATPQLRASEKLSNWLVNSGEQVEVIDEVTGGLLQTLLQQPHKHNLLKFHENPHASLSIHLTGLTAYWLQMPASTVDITINISYQGTTTQETHTLPYRSALVVHYAAEWICFRVLQIVVEAATH